MIVRRSCACGDIIQALPIAHALLIKGYPVQFQCLDRFHCVVERAGIVPTQYQKDDPSIDVDLDNTYEQLTPVERSQQSIRSVFIKSAISQLEKRDIKITASDIPIPFLIKSRDDTAVNFLSKYPKPWVMICPRSSTPVNGVSRSEVFYQSMTRTIPDDTWKEVASKVNGTCFWLGVQNPPPNGIIDLNVKDLREVMICVEQADVLATVDSGPMHIAGSMGIPIVVIHQAFDPETTFESCPNRTIIRPDLKCLSCSIQQCVLNLDDPPCQHIDPSIISTAINTITESK